MKKRLMAMLLSAAMLLSLMVPSAIASEENVYTRERENGKVFTAKKVSNPTAGEREADGLEPDPTRMNAYAWCMGRMTDKYGDYVYIGTNRNILYGSISSGLIGDLDSGMVSDIVKTLTNDEIYTDCEKAEFAQAVIVRCNLKTNEVETWFDAAEHPFITIDPQNPQTSVKHMENRYFAYVSSFRVVQNFKGNLYINATVTDPLLQKQGTVIYRINGNRATEPEIVYSDFNTGTLLRAMTVSADGQKMYFGGIIDDGIGDLDTKIVIYETETGEEADYHLIADCATEAFLPYEDDDNLPTGTDIDGWYTSYQSTGGNVWDMIEYQGNLYMTLMTNFGCMIFKAHKDTADPKSNEYGWVWEEIVGEKSEYGPGFGNIANYAFTPIIFKDDLYFLGFTNAFDPVVFAMTGLISYLYPAEGEKGNINDFFESLYLMERSLDNKCAMFRLTQDGEVQMVMGDKALCPENIEYVARNNAGFNNDEYSPNSSTLYTWRAAVYNDKLYVGTFDAYTLFKYTTKLTNGDLLNMDSDEFRQQLEYVKAFIELIMTPAEEESAANETPLMTSGTQSKLMSAPLMAQTEKETDSTMEDVKAVADFYRNPVLGEPTALTAGTSSANTACEKLSETTIDVLFGILVALQQNADKEAVTTFLSEMLLSIPQAAKDLDNLFKYLTLLQMFCSDSDMIRAIAKVKRLVGGLRDAFESIDEDGIKRYVRISNALAANDNPGFELYCTEDGVNYETVTPNGFGDEYNYGCRTLLATDDGLMLGTANPFYGAQLWKITDGDEPEPPTPPAPRKSSYGGSVSTPTVTVPVSGKNDSVKVQASVSGSTATVKELKSADAEKVAGGAIEIDLSGLNKTITAAKIPEKMVDEIADKGNLAVKLSTATVTFDAKATESISGQTAAGGLELKVETNTGSTAKLTAKQQEAIKGEEIDAQVVVNVSMLSGGKAVGSFNGGSATLKVPYTLKKDQSASGLCVFFIGSNGEVEKLPCFYVNGEVVFTVEHFSDYVIAYDAVAATVCPKDLTCLLSQFPDLRTTSWYHDGIHYCLEKGLMNGMPDGLFLPSGDTTRAQATSMLWRVMGSPAVNYELNFSDVRHGCWYEEAVRWATSEGIINGVNDTDFAPTDPVTREQFASMLYRLAQIKGEKFDGEWTLDFSDLARMRAWAHDAASWCNQKGIMAGLPDGTFQPRGNTTRAQAASMIQRFNEIILGK